MTEIIRTVGELEALDPNTVLGVWHEELEMGCIFLEAREWILEDVIPPLAVIATGEQVRQARQTREKEQ
ncbi:hypothetical protein [Corynebacterium callunae]|uniref:hypothetical protein n=1 Tax=Corynebacterium callunae TaxID=1721 RepID=UPI001FFF3500|nr:hypothetical protein [Corynebacterium callunae]MCK2199178.1 hypothetical protein [Corynebacterium callunae]